MEMDITKGYILGLLILFGLCLNADAQCGISNCDTCAVRNGINICISCSTGYAANEDQTGCCFKGCNTDSLTYHRCNVTTGACTLGCLNLEYYGQFCRPCRDKIQNCEHCAQLVGSSIVECTQCFPDFFTTTNAQQCCPEGCDSCSGTTCTSCKDTFFLYNDRCDTCGDNCKPPEDGSARCDPVTGSCYLGCNDGWHGSRCDVPCTLARCDTCAYNEPTSNLTCNDCSSGYYGPYCGDCGINCYRGSGADPSICYQDGTCIDGCMPGYRGNKCETACDEAVGLQNCMECERYPFTCTLCKPGYWGNTCQYGCNVKCVTFDNERTCSLEQGSCDYGCLAGYYKHDCSGSCPFCGNEVCDINTGNCLDEICDPGYHGSNCNFSCPANCYQDIVTDMPLCDFQYGNCTEGCIEGYWGPFCNRGCNINCEFSPARTETGPLCEQSTGTCDFQCMAGFYQHDCRDACKSECVDGKCDIVTGTCLACNVTNPGYLCPDGTCSPVDTWGLFCQFNCTKNCVDGTCSRDDGTCTACKPEKYGAFCSNDCPHCATNQCYQTDGICIEACDPGWYKLECTAQCLHSGCYECNRISGECTSCEVGKYGIDCSKNCSTTCASDNNGLITCNRFSGECDTKACKVGYYTPQCTGRCSPYCQNGACDIEAGTCAPCLNGYFGQRCDGNCSTNCKNKDCEVAEDNCRLGCSDGYWGGRCEKQCNSNCDSKACNANTAECLFGCNATKFYGLTCAEPCNGNCINDICNRTGYCLRGCEVGWYGDMCQYTCPSGSQCTDGTCERLTGLCEDCATSDPGPNCPTADCPRGKRGSSCGEDCTSDNCQYDQCGRYNDSCIACPTGYYGDKCELTCSRCIIGTGCHKTSGVCTAGCQDGWYKPDCKTQCSNVCGSCERQSGECVTCAAGRWGTDCELICSSNCVETSVNGNNMVFCNKATGNCLGKACKVGFWREDCTQACNSNCLQDENNNRICEYLDGECSRGCKDTFFGKICNGTCSTRCREQLCTNFANSCDLGCAEGFYGATCSGTCSTHCAGQGLCNPSTGECVDGCELGYYGQRCDDPCKNTCEDGTCNDVGGCTDCGLDPVGNKCRIKVCDPGLYGPTCETDCPGDYCLNNQCKRTTGICETGCRKGYYGAYCTEICQCFDDGTDECEQSKGECICRAGSYGALCDLRCNAGCVDFTCERDGTCSNGCVSGKYGLKCEDTCTNCLNQACNSANGNCMQGCVEGFYGPQCNLPCKSECKACDIQTGGCTSCVDNYYSLPACDQTCNINCNAQVAGRTCNQANGGCIYGCKTGYYSQDCRETCGNCDRCDQNDGSCPSCNAGWWGTTCKNQCSSSCARGGSSNQRMCRQSDGYCEFGCDVGYYGASCSSTCLGSNCAGGGCDRLTGTCTTGCLSFFYDTNCDQRCDACRDGQCEQANGQCIGDCPANSYGVKCDKACLSPLCTDATCDKFSGYCPDCQVSPKGPKCSVQDPVTAAQVDDEVLSIEAIIGITVGSVAVIIIFVIVFVCCMNYKRRYDDAKTEIHLPSDVIERLSTHRSLRSHTSDAYPVARIVDNEEKDFVLF